MVFGKINKSAVIRPEIIIISLLIIISIFFRFWQIKDYAVFLGDEGRDMIVMRNIFVNYQLPFLGPTASVGGFFLGPIYYWMAAPFLFLSNYDPVGPSYMVALFGVATVLLLYKFLKETCGIYAASIASILYAIAPLIVKYSRSSWNPNPLPFFSLLSIYFAYKAIKTNNKLYYLGVGAALGVAFQLHYLGLALVPILFLIFLINNNLKNNIKNFIFVPLGATITFSPFLLFEIKNNFPNFRTILEFATRGSTIKFKLSDFIYSNYNLGGTFFAWISGTTDSAINRVIFLLSSLIPFFGTIRFWKDKEKRLLYSIGLVWFIGGLFILRSYRGQIHDYYLGILFPAPFFVLGLLLSNLKKNLTLKIIGLFISTIIFLLFISNGFYKSQPNRQIEQASSISDKIIEASQGKSYNFALITDSNSDHAYRYFLDIKGYKPKLLEEVITEQLIVLCESKTCSPLGHPLWEIAGFGRAEIVEEKELQQFGFKVLKLKHWSGEPSPAGRPAVKGI